MEKKGITVGALAIKSGLSREAIYKLLGEEARRPRRKTLSALAEALDVTIAELGGSDLVVSAGMRRVPVIGDISCGEPIIANREYEEYLLLPEAGMPSGEIVAVRMQGDSMINAGLRDGYLALLRVQDVLEDGEIFAVCIGEEATIKRVRRLPGLVVLEPANDDYEPNVYREELVRPVGKVIGAIWAQP
jgi:repressor LexA